MRLRNEIDQVIAKYNGEVTYESLLEMKYLDMVFNETLRKYPVVDTQFRKCSKSYRIPNSDLTIPKDSAIVLAVHALHHD